LLSKLKSLTLPGQATKNELLCVLKEDAMKFNLQDIVRCSLEFNRKQSAYIPVTRLNI
jgi:hypothetical protein